MQDEVQSPSITKTNSMADEHDSWLEGIGVDVNGIVNSLPQVGGPFQNPDANQGAVGLNAASDFVQGFAKGAADVGIGVAQSAGAMTNPFGALANVTAAAAGEPGADKALLPDMTVDTSAQSDKNRAAVFDSFVSTIENPLGSAADAGGKIATSDHPFELIGEGVGRGVAIGGAAVAGSGEVGFGEAAVGENAASGGASNGALAEPPPQGIPVTVNDPALAGVPPTLDDPPIGGIPPTLDDPALAGVGQDAPAGVPATVDDPALAATAQAEPLNAPAGALPAPAPAPGEGIGKLDSAFGEAPVDGPSPLAASLPDPAPAPAEGIGKLDSAFGDAPADGPSPLAVSSPGPALPEAVNSAGSALVDMLS